MHDASVTLDEASPTKVFLHVERACGQHTEGRTRTQQRDRPRTETAQPTDHIHPRKCVQSGYDSPLVRVRVRVRVCVRVRVLSKGCLAHTGALSTQTTRQTTNGERTMGGWVWEGAPMHR